MLSGRIYQGLTKASIRNRCRKSWTILYKEEEEALSHRSYLYTSFSTTSNNASGNNHQPPNKSHHRMKTTVAAVDKEKNTDDNDDDRERVLMKDLGDGIFNIQLNRPKKRNALDMKMFESIASTISDLQTDHAQKGVRCIILSGNGKAFCTGLDVPSMIKPSTSSSDGMSFPHTKMKRLLERPSGYDKRPQQDIGDNEGQQQRNIGIGNLAQDVAYLWRTVPIPVISVLHGMCFGGGLQIALGADFRISTEDCKISIMEAKWGLIPDMSATITLRELVSIDVAKELTFTGRIISGVEAKEYGLVTKIVSNTNATNVEHAMEEAVSLAKEMVKQSPDAIAAAKCMYQKTWIDLNEEQCLDLESRLQKKLLPSWNQFAASSKNFGLKLSYMKQQDLNV